MTKHRIRMNRGAAIGIVALLLASGFLAFYQAESPAHNQFSSLSLNPSGNGSQSIALATIPYSEISNISVPASAYNGSLNVMISFSLSNQSKLSSFLANLSNPMSPQYHEYLSASSFDRQYSPNAAFYQNVMNYLSSYGVKVTTYADRVAILTNGPSSAFDSIFHTSISKYSRTNGGFYYEPSSKIELPAWIAQSVSQVTGLDNLSHPHLLSGHAQVAPLLSSPTTKTAAGYPTPVSSGGVQYIWGSDMQVAYNEQTLFNFTNASKEVVATILWPGVNASGQTVAPFYPQDIYAYYNSSIPTGQPHAKVYGVPLGGAPAPGPSAQYDTIGAVFENTLDLEMVGSTAPGASIFNVYGMDNSFTSLDSAFAYILSPNATFKALDNVSVISNSWGSSDYNDSLWMTYLEEAQARGITVLASSGDSGDNPSSSKYAGGPGYVEYPSSMAYNTFGVTAVGGTTVTLTSALNIANQIVWNISSSDTADSGPAGTTGGISTLFSEPSWQLNSEANNLIGGQGRATPDISGIANNTIVFMTVDGTSYYANPSFYYAWGTSIASPLTAGILAEINAILQLHGKGNLGYINPTLYQLGTMEYAVQNSNSTNGYYPTGNYTSPLPALPFTDVTVGQNDVYSAQYAWDFPTGWGSMDAYNFTVYALTDNASGTNYSLSGVENDLNLSSMTVNSPGETFNASIQQNLFAADSLGAPLYWIQNVIYISGSNSAGWAMNYTGWVVFPFYGIYPYQVVYEYNFPLTGKLLHLPQNFMIKTWLENTSIPDKQVVYFQINNQILNISVPGAAYIIGALNYSYYYDGNQYYNGPYPDNPTPGGLSPQFGLVGGPGGGTGNFQSPTSGTLDSAILPTGSISYVNASTEVFGTNITQTGETASNLDWVYNGVNYTLGISAGSTQQGVLSYYSTYPVTFTETGLPSNTEWYLNLSNGEKLSSTGTAISVNLSNGKYTYTVESANSVFTAAGGTFTISNGPASILIHFAQAAFNATFSETGLPSGSWYVNISGTLSVGGNVVYYSGPLTGTSYKVPLANGDYVYSISTSNKIYAPSPSSATFTVNGASPAPISITFSPVLYVVTFSETGYSGTWYVNISGIASSGPITGSSHSFNLHNGTYTYSVAATNRIYAASGGTLSVNGANKTQSVSFSLYNYTVTFSQTGLVSGQWYVNISGTESDGSGFSHDSGAISGSTYKPAMPNGSYTYTIAVNNRTSVPNAYSGSFSVSGASPSPISIVFTPVTYAVTFTETGLSSGNWYVNFTGQSNEAASGSVIVVQLTNGTHQYTVATSNKLWHPSPSSSTVTVSGGTKSVSITFVTTTYSVTFTRTGFDGTWYLNLTGGTNSGPLTGSSYTIQLANGSYSYTAQTGDKIYEASGSSLTVNGADLSIPVAFVKVTYATVFTETGLNQGGWYINITGTMADGGSFSLPSGDLTTSTYSAKIPNGTYSFSVSRDSRAFMASIYSGTISIQGSSPTPFLITFTPVTYLVTFNERGYSGTWSLSILDKANSSYINSGQITNASYSLQLTNGSYDFNVTFQGSYQVTSQENFVVDGLNQSVQISFARTFTVTFSETGLASGTTWYVTFDGVNKSSTSASITFILTNGTYSYTVGKVSGYTFAPKNGNLTVQGNQLNQTISFTKSASPSTSVLDSPLVLLFFVAVAAVILIAGAIVARRRH